MALSMTAIWDDTAAFLRREGSLLAPLALATLGLGDAGANLVSDSIRSAGSTSPGVLVGLGLAASMLLSLVGQLAILALALSPGATVGEGLRTGIQRLPKLLLLTLAMVWMMVLLALPFVAMLAGSGIDLSTQSPQIPPFASFYLFLIIVFVAWLGLRLMPMNALLVDRNPPILTVLRDSFRMTRGHAARLLAVAVIYVVLWSVITGATTFVVGSLFAIVGKFAGMPYAGKVMAALAGGMVAAGLGLVATVFTARLYRALDSGRSNGI